MFPVTLNDGRVVTGYVQPPVGSVGEVYLQITLVTGQVIYIPQASLDGRKVPAQPHGNPSGGRALIPAVTIQKTMETRFLPRGTKHYITQVVNHQKVAALALRGPQHSIGATATSRQALTAKGQLNEVRSELQQFITVEKTVPHSAASQAFIGEIETMISKLLAESYMSAKKIQEWTAYCSKMLKECRARFPAQSGGAIVQSSTRSSSTVEELRKAVSELEQIVAKESGLPHTAETHAFLNKMKDRISRYRTDPERHTKNFKPWSDYFKTRLTECKTMVAKEQAHDCDHTNTELEARLRNLEIINARDLRCTQDVAIINKNRNLAVFYNRVARRLENIFIGYQAASEKLLVVEGGNIGRAGKIAEALIGLLPGGGLLGMAVGAAADAVNQEILGQEIKYIAKIAGRRQQSLDIADNVGRVLALRYQNNIENLAQAPRFQKEISGLMARFKKKLTIEEQNLFEQLADFAVLGMLQAMKNKQIFLMQPIDVQLFNISAANLDQLTNVGGAGYILAWR